MLYQNAVSDKLTIIAYPETASLFISSKLGAIKYYVTSISEADSHEIKALLSSSIFSKTTVIECESSFVLCPANTSFEEKQNHYYLSFGNSINIISKYLDDQVEVVFNCHRSLVEIESLLVNPLYINDVDLLHQYKGGLSRTNAIYFSVINQSLIIRVYSAGFMLFSNRFKVVSNDDVFYFVMLAAELLKIDTNAIHFEYIGLEEDYVKYKALFADYLPMLLHLPLLAVDNSALNLDAQIAQQGDWLSSVALQCV